MKPFRSTLLIIAFLLFLVDTFILTPSLAFLFFFSHLLSAWTKSCTLLDSFLASTAAPFAISTIPLCRFRENCIVSKNFRGIKVLSYCIHSYLISHCSATQFSHCLQLTSSSSVSSMIPISPSHALCLLFLL
jgi:hypothetical protein